MLEFDKYVENWYYNIKREIMKTYNPRQCVELFHLLFLNQLGRKLDKKLYALKGGCNMRFYFNSIRYSEDMDIDIQTIHKDTLSKNVNQILSSVPFKNILQTHAIEILNSSAPKQTPTTQRWKISLKSATSILPLQTKIEFSRRKLVGDVSFEPINSQILKQYTLSPIWINHYSIQSMYEQKILALALRSATQARDIFDLYLLISSGKKWSLLSSEVTPHLVDAINNAKTISFADFKGQVVAYLLEEDQAQYDNASIWDSILVKVIGLLSDHCNEVD